MTIEFEAWEKLVNNAAIGVHLVGADGTVLWASLRELHDLGYENAPAEYIGHHIAEFHADPDVIARILALLSGGEELRAYPARLKARDGTLRHVLINSNVHWEAGSFKHTRCFSAVVGEYLYQHAKAAQKLSEYAK